MVLSRRDFLIATASAGAAGSLPGALLTPARATTVRRRAKLPAWTYGRGSFADDTVLMFRGNPSHTFYGTGPVPDAPQQKWRFRTATISYTARGQLRVWTGTGWTGTAVKLGDYIFVGSPGGYVYALQAYTGKLAWKHRGGGMFKGSACAYENRIYIGNTDNLLRCIDAETGHLVWRHDTGNDLDSSPCVVDGRLYIAGENGHARCLDPQTGRLIWKTFVGGTGPGTPPGSNGSETSPAVADGNLYTATYDGVLFCIDTKNGRVRWKAKTFDDTDASPVVSGDFVYAAAEDRASRLYCFAREDGREVWRYEGNDKGFWSTPAVVGDRLWVGGDDNKLHCVDAKTGKGIWTFKADAAIWSSPAIVDGKAIFGSRDHHLYIVDAETGKELWKTKLDGRIISSPCVVGGYIWIGTATGYIYCFGP